MSSKEVLYLVWSVSGRASIRLMNDFIEKYFYKIVRTNSAERVVYLKDGRIFKFVDEMGCSGFTRRIKAGKRWTEMSDEEFIKEYLEKK